MPAAEGDISGKQLAAYAAAAKICRTSPKGKDWWDNARPDARQKELEAGAHSSGRGDGNSGGSKRGWRNSR